MKILLHTVIIVVKYKVRCKLRIPITISFIQNCIEVLSNFPEREKNTKIKKNCSYFHRFMLVSKKKKRSRRICKLLKYLENPATFLSILALLHTNK